MDGNGRGRGALERVMDDLRNIRRTAAPEWRGSTRERRDPLVARARMELRLMPDRRSRSAVAVCQPANDDVSDRRGSRVQEARLASKEPGVMSSPPTEALQISLVAADDGARRLLLRLEGELDLATTARLRTTLGELGEWALVLDLSGLTFTDSSGLALLLEVRARALRSGMTVRVRGATGQTRDLLERTRTLELLVGPPDAG